MAGSSGSEGGLGAPVRHNLDWKSPAFYDEEALNQELKRVFDVCHGCRRCVNLCNAFPTLFDLVDGSATLEVDGVSKDDYPKVSAHCYLCDLCFMTKCPYVPPHEWAVDFPKLMLRAKAVAFRKGRAVRRDKLLTSIDAAGKLAGIPVVTRAVNAAIDSKPLRARLDKHLGVSADAVLPLYAPAGRRKSLRRRRAEIKPVAGSHTTGKVALFATCFSRYHAPEEATDLRDVFEHNGIAVLPVSGEKCCGMPKLELGDLDAVEKLKQANVASLGRLLDDGCDVVAPVPSCVLMFRQELPLMFPDDAAVQRLKSRVFDPAEYLMLRHGDGLLDVGFKRGLGKVAYHAACHTRVQNVGLKTRELLQLVPDTEVTVIERCSGHDGTYAMRSECRAAAVKIGRPAARKADQCAPDYFTGDCTLARRHLASLMQAAVTSLQPMSLLKAAYGI